MNAVKCTKCGLATDVPNTDMEMVLCDFGVEEHGYHIACLPEAFPDGKKPEGEWCCPVCEGQDNEQGRWVIEAIINKRTGSTLEHTARCTSSGHANCRCRKRKQLTMYLAKWKDFDSDVNTWQKHCPNTAGMDLGAPLKRFQASHSPMPAPCSSCHCVLCICNDPVQMGIMAKYFT